jgi:uncharacterized protein
MKIETQHIPPQGLVIRRRIQATDFETLNLLMANEEADFTGTIDIDLSVVPLRDLIQVEGSVRTRVRLECSRCIESFDAPLHRQFALSYSRKIPEDLHRSKADGIELTAQQIGVILYQGDEIDLRDALAEQVVLALPFKPLCDEACQGLCPGCGANLNQEACRCGTKTAAGPFDALKKLRFPAGD